MLIAAVVLYTNSLDLDETINYLESHLDPSLFDTPVTLSSKKEISIRLALKNKQMRACACANFSSN